MSLMWRHLSGVSRSVSFPSYANVVLSNGPVGYWRMDAASGTTELDQSGNGRNGTITGTVTLGRTGAITDGDAAELFDGATGYLTMGNVAAFAFAGAFSVEAWFGATTSGSNPAPFASKCDSNVGGWLFGLRTAGTLQFSARDASGTHQVFSVLTTATYLDGNWHHAVATWDGTTNVNGVQIYVDGVSTGQGTAAAFTPDVNAVNFMIGARDSSGAANFFTGSLDEVAVYNKALTAGQVSTHYATAKA